jgi:DNA adenine methylase
MRAELFAAYEVLHGLCLVEHTDFMEIFHRAKAGDFFYLDPPYQGTSNGRDQRYIAGVSRQRMVEGIELLNSRNIPFILSYDGRCGDIAYGDPLPENIAHHLLLDVGRSSQATLNGFHAHTVESIYVSHGLARTAYGTEFSLRDFAPQIALFA